MRHGDVVVDEVHSPRARTGQVLVRTLACGICGSDRHALSHGDRMTSIVQEMALGPGRPLLPTPMDVGRDVVLGHEFCGVVIGCGRKVTNVDEGDVVVSVPLVIDARGAHSVGYSNDYPGGFGELMVLSDALLLKVPDGTDPMAAALTEPLAVGLHAVARAAVVPGEAAVVIGCGTVGIAVVIALARRGIEPIIAVDPSPLRRRLATWFGAHEVVDPGTEPAMEAWHRVDGRRPVVVFEAVGEPGSLDAVMRASPRWARIVVVGLCLEDDRIQPAAGVARELTIHFAFGYDLLEFGDALQAIATGEVDLSPMTKEQVGLDDVGRAMTATGSSNAHAKVMVVPHLERASSPPT